MSRGGGIQKVRQQFWLAGSRFWLLIDLQVTADVGGPLPGCHSPPPHLSSPLCCPPAPLSLSFLPFSSSFCSPNLFHPFMVTVGSSTAHFLSSNSAFSLPPVPKPNCPLFYTSCLMCKGVCVLCVCLRTCGCVLVPPKSCQMHHISFLQTQPGDISVTLVVSERVHVLLNYRDCIPHPRVWVFTRRLCLCVAFFLWTRGRAYVQALLRGMCNDRLVCTALPLMIY